MKIPLFDIDGTLVKTANPFHKKAFHYAFERVYKIDAYDSEINPEGMTDNQIILEVLKLHGLNEIEIKKNIKTATDLMAYFFVGSKNDMEIKPLGGVIELLSNLKSQDIPLGILSGNVEEIAWTKLEIGGIKNFFVFGAFGDKAFKRVDLVEIARQNAQKTLGRNFETSNFVIVGDTPKDIKCARDAGINVIAVSTGIYSFEDLDKEKPDLLVKSLEEKEKIIDFLNN